MDTDPITILQNAINEKLDYFRMEYNLSYAEVIGVLQIIIFDLYGELKEESNK